ncbi:MAG: esterase [Burkholderiaceae bacterium]|nr:esterase [Desulfobacterales bacterium]MDP3137376.1 esterase [Burkholderiaceae bacterium]
MNDTIFLQKPADKADALVLLFHGVGASPADMVTLGRAVAAQQPRAAVVCIRAPHASDPGRGYQWFAVTGITEDNRSGRIAVAMPLFVDTVRHWQHECGIDSAHTTLIGFSQGAIMSLESTRLPEPVARRIVAIAGRYATPFQPDIWSGTLHFLHGDKDPVITVQHSIDAASWLKRAGATVTLDLIPDLGHRIDDRLISALLQRMADDR